MSTLPEAPVKPHEFYVYFIQAGARGPVKIGFAFNPYARLEELQVGNPFRLQLIGAIQGGRAEEIRLHERFKSDRLEGEWFKPSAALLALAIAAKPPTEAVVIGRDVAKLREVIKTSCTLTTIIGAAKSEHRRRNPVLCRTELWEKKYKPALQVASPHAQAFDLAYQEVMAVLPCCRPYCRCEHDNGA